MTNFYFPGRWQVSPLPLLADAHALIRTKKVCFFHKAS